MTFPTLVFGLFTRWFHRWALLAGWLGGMVFGTVAERPAVLVSGMSRATGW